MQQRLRRSNAERTARTRDAILDAARKLFIDNGFAGTGTPEIVAGAGLTRGALYHHFADKTELFRDVVRREAGAVADDIASAVPVDTPPAEALRLGMRRYFQSMTVPGRARLLLIEGPAVLGPTAMRAIDRETGGAELLAGLRALTQQNDEPLTEALADLVSAMADRAALAMSLGEERGPYLEAVEHILRRLE